VIGGPGVDDPPQWVNDLFLRPDLRKDVLHDEVNITMPGRRRWQRLLHLRRMRRGEIFEFNYLRQQEAALVFFFYVGLGRFLWLGMTFLVPVTKFAIGTAHIHGLHAAWQFFIRITRWSSASATATTTVFPVATTSTTTIAAAAFSLSDL
jgi:hypothetical protein